MKHIIFSNIDNEYSDYYDESIALEDERINLDIETEGKILVIADLGLWDGRRPAYKILNANISEILYTDCDYVEWYDNGHNIRCKAIHHDGTNYYEYREIINDDKIDNLLDAIYNGDATRSMVNRYTRSIRPYVADVYGW